MKNKTKKLMAMILLILVLFNGIPVNTFATFITDMNSNATFGVISGSLATYGHELHYSIYDGATYIVFCTQYGNTSPTGLNYTYNEDFTVQYNNGMYSEIAQYIYFGYTMNYGVGIPTTDAAKIAACCTQQYVWEYIHNNIDSSINAPSRDSWTSSYMSSIIYSEWLTNTQNLYNEYYSDVSFNGSTQGLQSKSVTITDTNGTLQNYGSFSEDVNGFVFSHEQESNELNITVLDSCTATETNFNSANYNLYKILPNGSTYDSSTMSGFIYVSFASGAIQNVMFSNYINPKSFNVSVRIENGNLLVVKTNINGDTLSGCTFEVYKDLNCTDLVGTGTTNENGEFSIENLLIGTYYVKEVSVPEGYLLDTEIKSITINPNETSQVSFQNNEPTGQITITKTDSDTGNSNRIDGSSYHGDATIKGAVYTLYANSDIYNVAKTVKYFSKNDPIATFTFDEYGVSIVKIVNNTSNVKLSINGNILCGLPMGSYYAYETTVPTGYTQDTNKYVYDFSYKDSSTAIISLSETVNNTIQKAKFEVIKISTTTNEIAKVISGAEFTAILTKYVDYYGSFEEALKHVDEYAKDEYSVFTTGEDGHGISGYLAYGKYTVNETSTPDGVNTVEEFYVTIDKNSNGVIKELVANDTPFEAYIKLVKQDATTGKVVTYSNTTFCLYKLNEETNEWEKVSCKVGNVYYTSWTTNDEGYAVTENKFETGTYMVKEIETPEGFLEPEEDVIFELSNKNETLEYDEDYDAWITVTVKNEQPLGNLELTKNVNLREDVDLSLIEEIDFTKISFELVAKENIIDYSDGEIIYEKGNIIDEYTLDSEGNLTVENLPMGKYYLKEVTTDEGLVLDEKEYDVIFSLEDLTTKKYVVNLEIDNNTTIVEFSKTDITGNSELEGNLLQVLDENNNIIDEWVSNDTAHTIEGLEVGKTYILHEELAIDGYVKASDIEFVVQNTENIQKVAMINKVVEVIKTDAETGEYLEGAELVVIDEDGNIIDNWISTKEAHQVSNLEEGKVYTLIEKVAPNGYSISENIEFTVSYDKETQVVEMKDNSIVIVQTGNEINFTNLYKFMGISLAGIIIGIIILKKNRI